MKKRDMENNGTAFLVHTLHFLEVFHKERQNFSNKIHQQCSLYGHPKANRLRTLHPGFSSRHSKVLLGDARQVCRN